MDYWAFTDRNFYNKIVVFSIISRMPSSGGFVIDNVLYAKSNPGEVIPVEGMFLNKRNITMVDDKHLIYYLFVADTGLNNLNTIF